MHDWQIGYCTNVHAGTTLSEVKRNLADYTCEIKQRVSPAETMGVGLWLSNETCREMLVTHQVAEFSHWLQKRGLVPFTCNGFPFSNFHQPVVKHQVYLPTWADPQRLDYTVRLAWIHAQLLKPAQSYGTISTLPLAWPLETDDSFYNECARNLRTCAEQLVELREQKGVHIFLSIEPEPGCVLDSCEDVVNFFQRHLLTGNELVDQRLLEFIGVCHDVCHSAVMFERQASALEAYRNAGIRVGKFQISNAIEADFRGKPADEQQELFEQLKSFAEDRYLHQTTVQRNGVCTFFEDLPSALEQFGPPDGVWRVHFHVPVYSDSLGTLGTSQREIDACLSSCLDSDHDWPAHFEIETYAWDVLPVHLRSENLVESVVKELNWFQEQIRVHRNA